MTRPSYPSDLTHAEWQLLEPEMPALKTGGRPRSVPWRASVNGILYVLRTGCAWRSLPHDLPGRVHGLPLFPVGAPEWHLDAAA